MPSHDSVRHPFRSVNKRSNKFMSWVADRVLPSSIMFYTALIAPLAVLPMSPEIRTLLMLIAGSWIQWWALPALQRRQNEISDKQDAKADADHEALTHLAVKLDRIESILLHPSSQKGTNG